MNCSDARIRKETKIKSYSSNKKKEKEKKKEKKTRKFTRLPLHQDPLTFFLFLLSRY